MNGGAQSGADTAKAVMATVLSGRRSAARAGRSMGVAQHDVRPDAAGDTMADRIRRWAVCALTGLPAKFCCSSSGSACSATPAGPIAIGCRPDGPATPAPTPTAHRRRRPPAHAAGASTAPQNGVLGEASGRPACCASAWSPTRRRCTSSTIASRKTGSISGWRASSPKASAPSASRWSRPTTKTCPTSCAQGDIDLIMAGYVPDPSIDGRRLVERLSRLRPLHDRARRHGRDLPVAGRSRRQARRDLRRPGGRTLGARQTFPTRASASSRATTAGSKRSRRDQADALIYDYPFAAEEIKAHPRTVIVKYNLNQSKYAVGDSRGQLRPGLRGEPAPSTSSRRRRSTPT